MNCLTAIMENYANLSKNEKKIADYLLASDEEIYKHTVQKLADKIQVTPSCIMRFTKKIGYESFTQFRIDLARESQNDSGTEQMVEDFTKSDDLETLVQKLTSFYNNTLEKTCNYLNYKKLEKAIELLLNAKRICIVAEGTSLLIGKDLARKFMIAGIDAVFFEDAPTQLSQAANLTPEDCLIAISYSGKTNLTNIIVKMVAEANVPSISISQNVQTNMVKYSTVALFVPPLEPERKIGSIASRMSCNMVTDILYLGTIQTDLNGAVSHVMKTRGILQQLKK